MANSGSRGGFRDLMPGPALQLLRQCYPLTWIMYSCIIRARRSESQHSNATVRLSTHSELQGTTFRAASGSVAFGRPRLCQIRKGSPPRQVSAIAFSSPSGFEGPANFAS